MVIIADNKTKRIIKKEKIDGKAIIYNKEEYEYYNNIILPSIYMLSSNYSDNILSISISSFNSISIERRLIPYSSPPQIQINNLLFLFI